MVSTKKKCLEIKTFRVNKANVDVKQIMPTKHFLEKCSERGINLLPLTNINKNVNNLKIGTRGLFCYENFIYVVDRVSHSKAMLITAYHMRNNQEKRFFTD